MRWHENGASVEDRTEGRRRVRHLLARIGRRLNEGSHYDVLAYRNSMMTNRTYQGYIRPRDRGRK